MEYIDPFALGQNTKDVRPDSTSDRLPTLLSTLAEIGETVAFTERCQSTVDLAATTATPSQRDRLEDYLANYATDKELTKERVNYPNRSF